MQIDRLGADRVQVGLVGQIQHGIGWLGVQQLVKAAGDAIGVDTADREGLLNRLFDEGGGVGAVEL